MVSSRSPPPPWGAGSTWTPEVAQSASACSARACFYSSRSSGAAGTFPPLAAWAPSPAPGRSSSPFCCCLCSTWSDPTPSLRPTPDSSNAKPKHLPPTAAATATDGSAAPAATARWRAASAGGDRHGEASPAALLRTTSARAPTPAPATQGAVAARRYHTCHRAHRCLRATLSQRKETANPPHPPPASLPSTCCSSYLPYAARPWRRRRCRLPRRPWREPPIVRTAISSSRPWAQSHPRPSHSAAA
mmetsp:Transcript_19393/g.63214  ORF Transcript_19393/g.63214 Transcript_19393/m.63214 type:complete len:246 (-) Transcript_19393:359-1096(-)